VLHASYLIPLFPLAGFALLTFAGRRIGKPLAGWVATLAVTASFVVSVGVLVELFKKAPSSRRFSENWFTWFSVDRLHATVGVLIDPLSVTMILFVTGVSAIIHLYAIGYMDHDEDFPRFFAYFNLFVFSMLMLVLSNNFLLTFLGWEGVGVCSYFLIAFWFARPTAASAGKKAMIYNRIGDAGFLIAIFLIFERTGSFDYGVVFSKLHTISTADLTAIALLLFMGAVGKSAQIPLFPWLADAMEGPTPVSALIHAATMVTAGVYLMCRINPILHVVPDAAHVVAWIGAATAFVGATAACAQQDIKKVLAYSTISQLGYMFLAAGSGAYVAAIFLMLTHAFYKALLFLGAGSVIHGLHDEQDLKKMGALRVVMPLTAATFLIAWFAIAGVPPFSGFWSKSQVLENAWAVSPVLWVIGAVTAVLTAYYIGREYCLVFLGERHWASARPGGEEVRDPGWVMLGPLVVLAFFSFFALFINLPFHPTWPFLERWLHPVVGARLASPHYSVAALWGFGVADAAFAVAGVGLSWRLWRAVTQRPALEPRFLQMAWFVDWSYDTFIARPSRVLAEFTGAVVERRVIDGAVEGIGRLTRDGGERVRRIQTGYVRTYALAVAVGVVVLVAYLATRAGG
jgi:NADH-quinone oxidoreductase subunit L